MEKTVQKMSNSTLDIKKDLCLFRAQRDPELAAFTRGKDLYLHTRKGVEPLYYLHRWTFHKTEKESLVPISPVMAGRFLDERGILCNDLGDQRGAEILRSWGYGILEEF